MPRLGPTQADYVTCLLSPVIVSRRSHTVKHLQFFSVTKAQLFLLQLVEIGTVAANFRLAPSRICHVLSVWQVQLKNPASTIRTEMQLSCPDEPPPAYDAVVPTAPPVARPMQPPPPPAWVRGINGSDIK